MPVSYTRAQLEGFLRSGHSVLVNGRHVERVEDLPSESELAVGDAERARAAREAVENQVANLTREMRRLSEVEEKARQAAPAPAPAAQPGLASQQPPAEPAREAAKAEPPAPQPEKQAESGGEAERYEAARRGRGRG
jgi:hypothetical protein